METAAKETLRIDKTNWTPVKFGDVVFEPKENAKDIYNEGIEHVVGLEHIDSGNIHLTRSGKLEETTTFSKKFKKGDVLFGRRRAYLKKAALADFDGICSGDITVFRAKKNLLPELLPFIVHNEKFFDYAIKHSAGGLSPRVKFKDLANYEFLLPPKDQQAELAELLWAMDEVIEREREVELKLSDFFESAIHHYTLGKRRFIDSYELEFIESKVGLIPKDWQLTTLSKYSDLITNGFVGTATPYYTSAENGIKYLQGMNVRRNKIDLKGLTYITKDFHDKQRKTQLKGGDILTVQSGHIGEAAVVPEELEGANCHAVIITRLDKTKWNPHFVCYFINSPIGQVKSKGITVGTTVAHINTSELQKYFVPRPSLKEQNMIVDRLKLFEFSLNEVRDEITSAKALQKSLINQIF